MSNQEITATEQVVEEPEVTGAVAWEDAADSVETSEEVSEETTSLQPDDTPAVEEPAQADAAAPADAVAPADAATSKNATVEDAAVEDVGGSVSIHQLKPGQHIKGTVKNITSFGAFVDIGLPQDGLVHISEIARKKVDKVEDMVSAGEDVDVWIKKVDTKRGRISLTMIKPIALRIRDISEEADLEGTVTRLESYGAFVDIGSERDGLVHISQITHDYINHPEDTLSVGETVKVKVLKVNRKKRQVDLSIKALLPPPVKVEAVVEPAPEVAETNQATDVVEDEPAPTAMAVAFAALQDKTETDTDNKQADYPKDKNRHKKEMDDIIARTLATTE